MSDQNQPRVNVQQVSQLFALGNSATYQVPIYQRDYAWSHDEIDALVSDLLDFYRGDAPYYLLGQIIVAPGEAPYKWELVDGQQRLTSLFLLFLAAYKILQARGAHKDDDQDVVDSVATLNKTLQWKFETVNYRRVLAAKGGDDVILSIIRGETLATAAKNNTAQNIKANYEELYDSLNAEFETVPKLIDFVERVMDGVWLMRLEMGSNQLALEVFEKINNRGKALNSADLLKNLLFSQVDSSTYEDLSRIWETAVEKIFAIKVRRAASMEFLMQAWIFSETGNSVSTRKVFEEWRNMLWQKPEAIARFAELLPKKSVALNYLGNGKTPHGEPAFELAGTRFFGAVQHLIVLLAGSHLSAESFKDLAKIVEDRTVLSLLARERSQDFQRILPKWAKNIQALEPDATIQDIKDASEGALEGVAPLLDQLEIIVPRLSYSQESQKKRIRYVLARVSSAIEAGLGTGHTENTLENCLKTSTRTVNGYDLDHVMPQSVTGSSLWPEGEDSTWVGEIGNLTLLHPSDNRSAGDVWPEEKAPDYNSSHLTLTRALCHPDELGAVNTRIQSVITSLHDMASPSLAEWTADTSAARAQLYFLLLKQEFEKTLL